MATGGRGQVLIPWPNRLQDGELRVRRTPAPASADRAGALECDPRPRSLGRLARAGAEPHRVVLGHVLHPQPGYPFALELEIEYELSASGLTVRTTATNIGSRALSVRKRRASRTSRWERRRSTTCCSGCPRARCCRSDERGIPVGTVAVDGTELDFRSARRIGETKLDNGYTDLERDDAARSRHGRGRTADRAGRSGSTRATRTSWCSPATSPPSSVAGSRSSR